MGLLGAFQFKVLLDAKRRGARECSPLPQQLTPVKQGFRPCAWCAFLYSLFSQWFLPSSEFRHARSALNKVHRGLPAHAQLSRHSRRQPHIRVTSVKPAVIPGATGLISIPVDTDDKQTPVTGGPGLTIPLFNASTTNTITISSVTIDPSTTGTFAVTTNCITLAPGASCNVVVTFNPQSCALTRWPDR